MEKRFFLALLLSFMVLMVYSSLTPKSKVIVNKEVIENEVVVKQDLPSEPLQKPPLALVSIDKELAIIFETDKLRLIFSKKGAYISEVFDKATQTKIYLGGVGLDPQFSTYLFDLKEDRDKLTFTYIGEDGLEVRKTYEFNSDYTFRLKTSITNSKLKSYEIYNATMAPLVKPDGVSDRYNEITVFADNVLQRKAAHSIKTNAEFGGKILWAGVRDRFFCSVIYPEHIVNRVVIEKISPMLAAQKLILELPEGTTSEFSFDLFVGPQDGRLLEKFNAGTELIVNFGTFDLIAKILLFLINVAHNVTSNWGWSIILMTIFVFVVLSPLSIKSFVSMKRIQLLQPKTEEIKIKFKDNPQKMNAEIMELYRREKVNPMGGCLPMLLQIPVFFSLYQLLMRLNDLKGARFLWINDLSQPDRLIVFKGQIPFLGNELNILPLLMAGTMFAQQKLTSSAAAVSKEAVEQQKIMGIMMPIVFGVLFYKISSGLVLYWFVNSLLTLGFQWKISRSKKV